MIMCMGLIWEPQPTGRKVLPPNFILLNTITLVAMRSFNSFHWNNFTLQLVPATITTLGMVVRLIQDWASFGMHRKERHLSSCTEDLTWRPRLPMPMRNGVPL